MTTYANFKLQMTDPNTGEIIQSAGGTVYVATNGSAAKATLYNKDGSSLANPITPTRGMVDFWVADTVETVDLYGMSPDGYSFQKTGVVRSGSNELFIDRSNRSQVLVVPFSIADTAAATETDTGFDTGTQRMWLPTPALRVSTLDATETIDVGTDGSGANDPDGFIAAASVATAAVVVPTLTNGSATLGVLLSVQDSANAGDLVPESHFNATSENITYTLTAGTDTAAGFIYLPYVNLA